MRRPKTSGEPFVTAPLAIIHDEGGQGLVEYALVAATIATGVMVAIFFLYNQIAQLFEFITDAVDALMGS